jgi:cobalt-zinc-cadmium efflux system outer membrane protein
VLVQDSEEPTGTLSLAQALSLALQRQPDLVAFSREIRAREAAVQQAGLLPNPELSATIENVGNPDLEDLDGPATTIQLGQLIELGRKRAARVETAALDRDLAVWDYEARRAELLTEVAQAFFAVLSAQQRVALAQQSVELARQVVTTAQARVKAGTASPVEETRARIALGSASIELQSVERELEAARRRLAATWRSTMPRFRAVAGEYEAVRPVPALEQLSERIARTPALARWATERAQRQATLRQERAQAVPDITVSGGVTRFHEADEGAFVIGVSVPLPLFNRNQGAIAEAQQRIEKAHDEQAAAEVRVATALAQAYQALTRAHDRVGALDRSVLPAARSAFEAVSQGYRLGKFGYLDVLDAQRTLFEAQAQYLQALGDYHQAVAEVEGLIGGPLWPQETGSDRPATESADGGGARP